MFTASGIESLRIGKDGGGGGSGTRDRDGIEGGAETTVGVLEGVGTLALELRKAAGAAGGGAGSCDAAGLDET